MRIFKNTWFTRFARKENITDDELRELVKQLEVGQADANLGGGVYKIRLARSGEGKSGAYRIIVFFKIKSRAFFAYGYAKSERDSLDKKETKSYKLLAKEYLNLSNEIIEEFLKSGKFIEI